MSDKLQQCRAQWYTVGTEWTRPWYGLWRGQSIRVTITCRLETGHKEKHGGWVAGQAAGQTRRAWVSW